MFIRAGRLLSSAIVLLCFAATVFAQVPSAQHVVLVIDENSSYSAVDGEHAVARRQRKHLRVRHQIPSRTTAARFWIISGWLRAVASPASTARFPPERITSIAAETIATIPVPPRPTPSPTTTFSAYSIMRESHGRFTPSHTLQREAPLPLRTITTARRTTAAITEPPGTAM